MSERDILITGAGGFLGGSMYEMLRREGEKVVGTTRSESERTRELGFEILDTSDREQTIKFIWDNLPKYVFNFGGEALASRIKENPDLGERANVQGVLNMIEALQNARRKYPDYQPILINANTVEAFGAPSLDKDGKSRVISERSPKNPNSIYGEQKKRVALLSMELAKKYKIKNYNIFQGSAAGVSIEGNISQKSGYIFADVARQIAICEKNIRDRKVSSGTPQIIRTGQTYNLRDFVNVNDALEAYKKVATKTPFPGGYIVCCGISVPLQFIVSKMISLSTASIVHKIEEFGGGPDRFYSHKKLTNATDWKPKTPLDETIKSTLDFQRREVDKE